MKCIDCGESTHGTTIGQTRLAICQTCSKSASAHAQAKAIDKSQSCDRNSKAGNAIQVS